MTTILSNNHALCQHAICHDNFQFSGARARVMTTLRNAFSLMMSSRSTIWSCSWSSRIDTRLHWWEYEVTNLGQNRGKSICSNCLTCMSLRMAPRNLRVNFHIDMQLVMAFCHMATCHHMQMHTLFCLFAVPPYIK